MLLHQIYIFLLRERALLAHHFVEFALDLLRLRVSDLSLTRDLIDVCLDVLQLLSAVGLEGIIELLIAHYRLGFYLAGD